MSTAWPDFLAAITGRAVASVKNERRLKEYLQVEECPVVDTVKVKYYRMPMAAGLSPGKLALSIRISPSAIANASFCLSECADKLELDARIQLQPLAAAPSEHLSKRRVANRQVADVRPDPIEWVLPGHTELEKRTFLLLIKRKSLVHAEGFA
jgi:hypothetical protein